MKKLIVMFFIVLGMNQAFALEENASSDCTSLNTSTGDAVVVSNGEVESNGENGSNGSQQ